MLSPVISNSLADRAHDAILFGCRNLEFIINVLLLVAFGAESQIVALFGGQDFF
jgi:hypothetical protein